MNTWRTLSNTLTNTIVAREGGYDTETEVLQGIILHF